jgi:hypothetical protein
MSPQTNPTVRLPLIVLAVTFLLLSSLPGCADPWKLLEAGKPERAYKVSQRQVEQKLKRNKPVGNDDLEVLASSYHWLQDALIRDVERLADSTTPDRWIPLHHAYHELLDRRLDIEPYLYLLGDGFDARYDTTSLRALTDNARLQAAQYCYGMAAEGFATARAGDKAAARTTYGWLADALDYDPDQPDWHTLKDEMQDLGTNRVLVEVGPRSSFGAMHLSRYMFPEGEVYRDGWLEIHYAPNGQRVDYVLETSFYFVDAGNNQERSSTDTYTREVVDGHKTEQVQVTEGDSTVTKCVTVPIIITVQGSITTVEQYKSASGSVSIQLVAAHTGQVRNHWRFSDSVNWSNTYQVCAGDARALPSGCSGSCGMYPSDLSMLNDLGHHLFYRMLRALQDELG